MNIYLLRHGDSVDVGAPGITADIERTLTDGGKEQMARIATGMKRLGIEIELMVSSTAVRALQTAETVAEAIGSPPLKESAIFYEGDSREIHASLGDYPEVESLMIVGHAPTLSELGSILISGNADLDIKLGKAGLILVEISSLVDSGGGQLKWVLPAEVMGALGE